MANEIVKASDARAAIAPIAPTNIGELMQLATIAHKSGAFGIRSPEDAAIRLMTGQELNIPAASALRNISVINGKPVLDAALIAGLCNDHHECLYWRIVETTAERCTIETKHARNGVTRLTYTIEQAQRAGLAGKDNWKKFPEAMLRARCTSALARIAYPGKVAGIYTPDEMIQTAVPVVEETVVDAEPMPDSAAEFIARIGVCDDVQSLSAIGTEVRSASLSQADKGRIREAYQQRSRELKAAAKARESKPQASYPGPVDGPDGVDVPAAEQSSNGEVAA